MCVHVCVTRTHMHTYACISVHACARARASHHTQRRTLHMYAGEFMSAALMAEQRLDPVLRDAAAHGFICICLLHIYVGIYVYIPTHPLIRSSVMSPHTGLYAHVCIYVDVYYNEICLYIHMYVYVDPVLRDAAAHGCHSFSRIFLSDSIDAYVCIYAYVYYMYVFIYTYVYMYTHTHAQMWTQIHVHTHRYKPEERGDLGLTLDTTTETILISHINFSQMKVCVCVKCMYRYIYM